MLSSDDVMFNAIGIFHNIRIKEPFDYKEGLSMAWLEEGEIAKAQEIAESEGASYYIDTDDLMLIAPTWCVARVLTDLGVFEHEMQEICKYKGINRSELSDIEESDLFYIAIENMIHFREWEPADAMSYPSIVESFLGGPDAKHFHTGAALIREHGIDSERWSQEAVQFFGELSYEIDCDDAYQVICLAKHLLKADPASFSYSHAVICKKERKEKDYFSPEKKEIRQKIRDLIKEQTW